MANIFSQDNPFNDLMSTIGDMAMISVAWTVFSIPVVTIGASTSAACEVARELQAGSSKGIFRSFWAAFKRRFPTNLADRHPCAVLGTRAVRPVVSVGAVRQHRRDPIWRNPCGDRCDRLAARLHPALVGAQQTQCGRANQAIRQARVNASAYRICRTFAEYLADCRGINRTAADVDVHPPIVDSRRSRSELLSADDARTQNIRPRINRIKNCDCRT